MEPSTPIRTAVACALAAVALVSCGGDEDDRERIAKAFEELREAIDASDARGVCAGLGAKGREQVVSTGHGLWSDCASGLRPLLVSLRKGRGAVDATQEPALKDVTVTTNAVATIVVEGQSLRIPFVKEGGRWKMDSFYGLTPTPSVAIP